MTTPCTVRHELQLLERQRTFRYESGKRAFDGLMQNIRQQVSSL